jgi:hypothetical protein
MHCIFFFCILFCILFSIFFAIMHCIWKIAHACNITTYFVLPLRQLPRQYNSSPGDASYFLDVLESISFSSFYLIYLLVYFLYKTTTFFSILITAGWPASAVWQTDSAYSSETYTYYLIIPAQGKPFDMTNVKEKLVQAERPSISEFQSSLLADADVAKRIANALDTKNTANFVTLIQHCSGVVLTSGIGMHYG